jgi:hypothetical protein
MKRLVIGLTIVCAIVASCNNQPKEQINPIDVELVVTSDTVYQGLNDCQFTDPGCTFAIFIYPTIVSGPYEEELRAELNKGFYASFGEDAEPFKDRAAMVDAFFNRYNQTKADFPDMAGNWYIVRESKVKRVNQRYISMSHTSNEFMGGAHPAYFTVYRNFDLSQGRWIKLEDVFNNPKDPGLTALVDSAVRAARGIAPDVSLKELGMFEETIKPTGNFEIRPKGIHFFYNSYDIAPYSMGYSQAIIPFESLTQYLRTDFNN